MRFLNKKNIMFISLILTLNILLMLVFKYKHSQKYIQELSNQFYSTNSIEFFDSNINKYFDNPTNKTEYEFQKIVYLVRSNGYICVNNTAEDIQNMMLDIKLISEKTGFDKYLFIGYNPHLNQYNNLLSIIKENQNLIKTILSLITIFSIFILILVILLQNKRRHSYFAIHYMQGSTLSQIILQQYLEIFIIFILAYITYFIILNNIFFIGNSKIHIILFLFIIFLNLILTVFSVKQIVANSVYKFLAVNETEEN